MTPNAALGTLEIKGDDGRDLINLTVGADGNYLVGGAAIVPPLAASAAVTITIDGGGENDLLEVSGLGGNYGAVAIHGGPGNDFFIDPEPGARRQFFGDDGDDSIQSSNAALDAFGGNGDDRFLVSGQHPGLCRDGLGRCRH